jgi:hypothetical protein
MDTSLQVDGQEGLLPDATAATAKKACDFGDDGTYYLNE